MSDEQDLIKINRASGAAIGFIIASLIFIVLVVIVKFSTNTPAIDADRATAISQALHEIHTNEIASFETVGWVDQSRGIVRLPIDTALQLAAQKWKNPAQARVDLNARAERAAAPAPKQPEKPSQFE
ncbi:MAG TPA: hypothetical protein VHG71_10170 [Verrucomicrobiae bacterium]|nr:hypothetical protein [Verrucomicrobiae bacterium]